MSQFSYWAYGLGVHAYLALPELMPATTPPDVTIRLPKADEFLPSVAQFPSPTDENEHPFLRPSPTAVCLLWPGVGRCLIRAGREIVVLPEVGVSEEVLRLHLLGSAFGVLLHQRGLCPFHASAVAMAGEAVLFTGQWGAGKSTLAAALHKRGYPLMADDVATLDFAEQGIYVFPAYPHLKLWPAAVESLGVVTATLPKVHPAYEKRSLRPTSLFSQTPLPLKSIFLLSQGEEIILQAAPPTEGLFALLSNWYLTRFGETFATSEERKQLFAACANLVHTVPIYQLQRSTALVDLPRLIQVIEAQVHRIAPPGGQRQ